MKSEPVFLISNGRSGSHMVRSLLNDGYSVTDFGEVFNTDDDRENKYFPYLVEQVRKNPDSVVRHRETQERRFDDYIMTLSEAAKSSVFIVDFKYAQSHHFDAVCHPPGSNPTILELIARRRYKVLHLIRKNLIAIWASALFAQANKIWVSHTSWHEPVLEHKITIDADTIRHDLTKVLMTIRFFNDCLKDHPFVLGLFYEDLLKDGMLCPVHAQRLAEFLGLPVPPPLKPATRKLAPRLEDYIENYDEVMAALAGTPFEELARL